MTKNGDNAKSWTRRIFVRDALKGWIGLVVSPGIYAVVRFLSGSSGSEGTLPKDVGSADALRPGISKLVQLGDKRVLVVRDKTGQVCAVNATCTHRGCSVRYEAREGPGELACNCHESRFTLHGDVLKGPASKPLEEYKIQTVGGRLILSASE
jgi:Rieske Fe-S protein